MLVLAKQTTNAIFNIKSFLPGVLISLLLLDIVYSTYRKDILRAIKSRLIHVFERLKTEKIAASTRKKAERKNVTFRFGRCQSTPPIMWIYFLQALPFGNL